MAASMGETRRRCYFRLRVECVLVLLAAADIAATLERKDTSQVSPSAAPPSSSYRLPTSVIPQSYELVLQPNISTPDPRDFILKGNVRIQVVCSEETNRITLNYIGSGVNISTIRVYAEGPSARAQVNYTTFEEDKERQFFTLILDKKMSVGPSYWIQMNFTAPITNGTEGFFYRSYTIKNIKREALLSDQEIYGTDENDENVARTTHYQTALTWFGNLVTPAWWSDLWLSEGLARFFAAFGAGRYLEYLNIEEQFIMENVHVALLHDGSLYNRPVYTNVDTPAEISAMFDWVFYKKAPSIVRMLHFFVGDTAYTWGIRSYIKKYSYKTATHDDFFGELSGQAKSHGQKIEVKDIMDTWILQTNYPVVTVSRDFNNPKVLIATQSRFIADITARDSGNFTSPFNYLWTIPLTFTSSQKPNFNQTRADIYWMYKEERTKVFTLKSPLPDCAKEDGGWILANVQQQGYYRVNYNTGNWLALCRQLQKNHTVISTINRAQIINDAWHLARASYIPVDIALSTVQYLDKERDYLPWYTALPELKYMESALSYSSLYGTFQAFMRAKLQNPLQQFKPPHILYRNAQRFLRSLITEQACHYGIDSCTSMANEQFRGWVKDSRHNKISPNILKAIACQAIANGRWDDWTSVLEMVNLGDSGSFSIFLNIIIESLKKQALEYKRSNYKSWKEILLSSLACSKKPWILKGFLHMLLQVDTPLGDRNALGVITSVIQNTFGRYIAWDFYRSNYLELKAKYTALSCIQALPAITEFFNTKLELKEVMAFMIHKCSEYDIKQVGNQIVDKIQINIRWLEINTPIIRRWMSDKGYLID